MNLDLEHKKSTPSGAPIPEQDYGTTPEAINAIRICPLNVLCAAWADMADSYVIGDDGYIYRRLKSNYYRSGRKHPYQQVRSLFGTGAKQITVHVHKAVALAFINKPEGATDVDHIDNDKTNNAARNLQWLTHRENLKKRYTDAKQEGIVSRMVGGANLP